MKTFPAQNDDGMFTPHIYVPWWLNPQQAAHQLDFPRGYHIEPRGGRRMPSMLVGGYVDGDTATYGDALRDEIRRKYGSYIYLAGEGEMIPNDDCYCDLDPVVKDKWGIPVLKFHWKWGESEIRQATHMKATFNSVFRMLTGDEDNGRLKMPRTPRAAPSMRSAVRAWGDAPNNSVIDPYGQCWDVKNLFVLDGAAFVSSPDKNPTLTIMALAARSWLAFSSRCARAGHKPRAQGNRRHWIDRHSGFGAGMDQDNERAMAASQGYGGDPNVGDAAAHALAVDAYRTPAADDRCPQRYHFAGDSRFSGADGARNCGLLRPMGERTLCAAAAGQDQFDHVRALRQSTRKSSASSRSRS